MLTHTEIRQRIAAFWTARNHKEVPGISLIPQNDPTTLFTGSGMQQFVPNLMGATHPAGTRVWNIQRCVRAQDIEEVGDNRHDTFFEMVGNWSFGDYFKKEQLPWMFELYTNKEHGFGLDPTRLYVTVFAGGDGMSPDDEAISIWKQIFTNINLKVSVGTADTFSSDQRITMYDATKNWWSRAGTPSQMPAGEIGGPDSELFYDFDPDNAFKYHEISPYANTKCNVNCDCGRFLEIGNSVFIQYLKQADGTLTELPKKNVDFGGGLERILAAMNGNPDVFTTDVFSPIVESLAPDYSSLDTDKKKNIRIIADHLRTATQMAVDGITPGPKEQNYVMRRLIRRAVRSAQHLNVVPEQLAKAVFCADKIFSPTGPTKNVNELVIDEIHKYLQTLENGKKEFQKIIKLKEGKATINGKEAFDLYQSVGLPLDEIIALGAEVGAFVDTQGFEEAKKAHADASRGASEQKFKGGLADQSEQVVKYHTATHLIHQALFTVSGSSVQQEGSNITGERLRFDFTCDHKPTTDEVSRIQAIANAKIAEALPVKFTVMAKEDALKLGAKAFFRDKYPDEVKVYTIGGKPVRDSIGAWNLELGNYSVELCGGPHVTNTKEIGTITIYKLEKIGKNIFRLYAK
ncbi:MAG: alanine--tRNA ligase-related protein [Candidatus Roizmanbacteria bacterium]